MQIRLAKYRQQLTRTALPVLRGKRASKRELKKLRETVLALSRAPGLMKDRIVDEGDPAMARLSEIPRSTSRTSSRFLTIAGENTTQAAARPASTNHDWRTFCRQKLSKRFRSAIIQRL